MNHSWHDFYRIETMTEKVCKHWEIEFEPDELFDPNDAEGDDDEVDKWWRKGVPLRAGDPSFYGNSDADGARPHLPIVMCAVKHVRLTFDLPAAAEDDDDLPAQMQATERDKSAPQRSAPPEAARGADGGAHNLRLNARSRKRERELGGAAAGEEDLSSPPCLKQHATDKVPKPFRRRPKQIRGSSAEEDD